jgi:tRNA threonylcarbamoyladenosine biosynthesis protein TsaE
MSFEIYLADERATMKIAASVAKLLDGRGLVFLEGQLGAGKTTFCRGILRAMGYNGAVKSPTFTLVEPYDLIRGQVYHFDLYRLNDPEELEYVGVDDYLHGDGLCLVEWPERGRNFLPDCDLSIQLTIELRDAIELSDKTEPDDQGRRLCIEGKSSQGQKICQILTELQKKEKLTSP